MLQNAYLLAKIGADTAENEQYFAEILPIGRRRPPGLRGRPGRRPRSRPGASSRPARGPPEPPPRTMKCAAMFWVWTTAQKEIPNTEKPGKSARKYSRHCFSRMRTERVNLEKDEPHQKNITPCVSAVADQPFFSRLT